MDSEDCDIVLVENEPNVNVVTPSEQHTTSPSRNFRSDIPPNKLELPLKIQQDLGESTPAFQPGCKCQHDDESNRHQLEHLDQSQSASIVKEDIDPTELPPSSGHPSGLPLRPKDEIKLAEPYQPPPPPPPPVSRRSDPSSQMNKSSHVISRHHHR